VVLFFPPCCCEAAMLEEGVSDHRHERMTVKALPGSSLEVIETEFFFQLLVSLLANPSHALFARPAQTEQWCCWLLPPADHLLIERDRGQFVPSRRRRIMANVGAERTEDPGRTQPRAAYPRRCSSNATGLHGRNSARILGIRASFQRDNLCRHF
jgi:hypothetical protein